MISRRSYLSTRNLLVAAFVWAACSTQGFSLDLLSTENMSALKGNAQACGKCTDPGNKVCNDRPANKCEDHDHKITQAWKDAYQGPPPADPVQCGDYWSKDCPKGDKYKVCTTDIPNATTDCEDKEPTENAPSLCDWVEIQHCILANRTRNGQVEWYCRCWCDHGPEGGACGGTRCEEK